MVEWRSISIWSTRHRHRGGGRRGGDNLLFHSTHPPNQPAFNHRSYQSCALPLLVLGLKIITMFNNVLFFRFLRTFEEFVLSGSASLGFGFLHNLGLIRVSPG